MLLKNRSACGSIDGVDKYGHWRHSVSVSFRRLFAMLFAVAMMFAPLAMPAGAAAAAPMASHYGQKATQDHCGGQAGQDKPFKAVDKSCCAAMCLGVAVAAVEADEPLAYAAMVALPSAAPFRRGFLGEIATPPPRLS